MVTINDETSKIQAKIWVRDPYLKGGTNCVKMANIGVKISKIGEESIKIEDRNGPQVVQIRPNCEPIGLKIDKIRQRAKIGIKVAEIGSP